MAEPCRDCGAQGPFVNSKGKASSCCGRCRMIRSKRHAQSYYKRMAPDKRHTLTHKRRAMEYGVEHESYSRTEILFRWGHRCAYCNEHATHLDHVTPLVKGGADKPSNIVPACAGCNLQKGRKLLWEWAATF